MTSGIRPFTATLPPLETRLPKLALLVLAASKKISPGAVTFPAVRLPPLVRSILPVVAARSCATTPVRPEMAIFAALTLPVIVTDSGSSLGLLKFSTPIERLPPAVIEPVITRPRAWISTPPPASRSPAKIALAATVMSPAVATRPATRASPLTSKSIALPLIVLVAANVPLTSKSIWPLVVIVPPIDTSTGEPPAAKRRMPVSVATAVLALTSAFTCKTALVTPGAVIIAKSTLLPVTLPLIVCPCATVVPALTT